MDKPHVLFVTGEYPPLRGGVADYTALLRSALENRGVDTSVLAARGAAGRGVHTVHRWKWSLPLCIRELAESHAIDMVHIQYQTGAFGMHPVINMLPTVLQSWMRIPVLTTFHDLRAPYLVPKAGRLRQAVMLRMARASRRTIVTNPDDERTLARAEIDTVRIPLGPSLSRPGFTSLDDQNQPTIGFFGFPSPEKGIDDLLRAIAMFDRRSRPKLLLVGAGAPDSGSHAFLTPRQVDELAGSLGVTVEHTGYLAPDEAAARLAATSVLALPFRHGASARSSALISMLALGPPVVTTGANLHARLGSLANLPQLVSVPPGDVGALHIALRATMSRGVTAEPLPREHSWEAIAEAHRDLYGKCLAEA